jgi:hypothetical protein
MFAKTLWYPFGLRSLVAEFARTNVLQPTAENLASVASMRDLSDPDTCHVSCVSPRKPTIPASARGGLFGLNYLAGNNHRTHLPGSHGPQNAAGNQESSPTQTRKCVAAWERRSFQLLTGRSKTFKEEDVALADKAKRTARLAEVLAERIRHVESQIIQDTLATLLGHHALSWFSNCGGDEEYRERKPEQNQIFLLPRLKLGRLKRGSISVCFGESSFSSRPRT